MKIFISCMLLFSFLVSVQAKPGEAYVLTGREKSIFGIYQADLKAYPDLYEGVDINEYYSEFKKLNRLDSGRKLKRGEKLMFPHTPKSSELEDAAKAEAARAAREAEAAAARKRASEAPAAAPVEDASGNTSLLFGADSRSTDSIADPAEIERARLEAARKNARYQAVKYFQHTLFPDWILNQDAAALESGKFEDLIQSARDKVGDEFADALTLHPYPGKNIWIFEFAAPQYVGEFFFFAMMNKPGGAPAYYSLEKGISFFGTGNVSILREWRYGVEFADLGGRKYKDLAGFLEELSSGRPRPSDNSPD